MKHLLLIFLAFLMISCDPNNEEDLDGTWTLQEVICKCSPIEIGADHTWTFDVDNGLLTVSNPTLVEYPLLATGTYDISVSEDEITIDTITYNFRLSSGQLYVKEQHHEDVKDVPELILK